MKENQIKSTVFLIVLIGTMITIYINPNNWIPPILFFILSTGGLIKSINKKKLKILILVIILLLVIVFNKLDLYSALLLLI